MLKDTEILRNNEKMKESANETLKSEVLDLLGKLKQSNYDLILPVPRNSKMIDTITEKVKKFII
jgi:hypothetical protein